MTTKVRTTKKYGNGSYFVPEGRRHYRIRLSVKGRPVTLNTGLTDEEDVKQLLRDKLSALAKGAPVQAVIGKVRWADGVETLRAFYVKNKRKSLPETMRRVRMHLTPFFGGRLLASITALDVENYIDARLGATFVAGAKLLGDGTVIEGKGEARPYTNGAINRELTILKRIFRLQLKRGTIAFVPNIEKLDESGSVRQGFFSLEEFEAVVEHLPPVLEAVLRFAYITGWRIRSEVLTLTWGQVDFETNDVRLGRGTDKSGEGRTFRMSSELRAILLARREAAREEQRRAGKIVQSVFFRVVPLGRKGVGGFEARTVKSFRKAWRAALAAALVGDRIPHDLRRTAVRNMIRRNVPDRVAQAATGHKTRFVFDHYNIVAEDDAKLLAVQIDGQFTPKAPPSPEVPAAPAPLAIVRGGKR